MKTNIKLFLILFFLTGKSVSENGDLFASDNLALNKAVTVSTGANGGYAVDGNLETKWVSATNSYLQYFVIDLGKVCTVNRIVLNWADGASAKPFNIQYSTDNTQWTTARNLLNQESVVDSLNISGQYIKIEMRGRVGGNKFYSLWEVELYGEVGTVNPEDQKNIDVITERIALSYLKTPVNDAEVTTLKDQMQVNGSWTNINYLDTHSADGWSPNIHFKNLQKMATAYRSKNSIWYGAADLREKIISGFEFVKGWSYPTDADNWWYNTIGDPQTYMIPLILMKGYIGSDSIKQYSSFLKDVTGNASHQGKNRTWVSAITINKGCIEDNYALTQRGFISMASTLSIAATQFPITGSQTVEGIKADNSYHQHRRQLQSGSYGLYIISDITTYILLCKDTPLSTTFTTAKRNLFSNMLLNGHLAFSYRKIMDFGTKGRAITDPDVECVDTLELDKMATIDTINAEKYVAWKNHMKGGPFPLPGNIHFWESDIMTHHGLNYYLSAKVISSRTVGTEMINNQGKKSYNLPMGATNIYTHGKEYNGIFPIWDWTRIPGTTAALNQSYATLPGYQYGSNTFGGGVSNGTSGVIAYEHNYQNLQAKKAYFFMGDAMFCLGTDITATHSEDVATSVNQCFAFGPMYINDGTEKEITGTQNPQNLKWAYHDNVGYIFPESGDITIQTQNQSGSWYNVNVAESPDIVNDNVFSIWMKHGKLPVSKSYQYIVVPDRTLNDFKSYSENHGFVVIQNDSKAQAVRNDIQGKYAVVFHLTDTVEIEPGFQIASNGPAIVLMEKNNSEYKISVADPTYSRTSTVITINKDLTGDYVANTGSNTTITFPLPTGEYTGSTVTKTYTEQGSAGMTSHKINANSVFLNPLTNVLMIHKAEEDLVMLYNYTGNKLLETRNSNIDLSQFVSGLYIVKINNHVTKIIKK